MATAASASRTAEHVAALAGRVDCLEARVALDERDHRRVLLPGVLEAAHTQAALCVRAVSISAPAHTSGWLPDLEGQGHVGEDVSHLQLDDLVGSQRNT